VVRVGGSVFRIACQCISGFNARPELAGLVD